MFVTRCKGRDDAVMKSIWSVHQHCMLGGTRNCPMAYMMLPAEGVLVLIRVSQNGQHRRFSSCVFSYDKPARAAVLTWHVAVS